MAKYVAEIKVKQKRDVDSSDPKILLSRVLVREGEDLKEFRDHCYVSINKNKELSKFLQTAKTNCVVAFEAREYTYKTGKKALTRFKNIERIGKA